METLLAPLGEINAFREAVECIGNNKLPIHISGCMDTQKVPFYIRVVTRNPVESNYNTE